MAATLVYRIQPVGGDLHGIQTETSDGSVANGVHVFETLAECWAVREWFLRGPVELATVRCETTDVSANGDYEGALLLAGRGEITNRRRFESTRELAKWVEGSCE